MSDEYTLSTQRRNQLLEETCLGNENLLEFIAAEKDGKDFYSLLIFMDNMEVSSRKGVDLALSHNPNTARVVLQAVGPISCPKPEYKQLFDFAVARAANQVEDAFAQRNVIAYVETDRSSSA